MIGWNPNWRAKELWGSAWCRKYDRDGTDTIDSRELGTLVRVLGLNPSDAEVKQMTQEIDHDSSGEIEFGEFLTLMSSKTLR